MTDRKIDYSADGIQLEIPQGAPGFFTEGPDDGSAVWVYIIVAYYNGWHLSYLDVLRLLRNVTSEGYRASARRAMICEAAAYWARYKKRLIVATNRRRDDDELQREMGIALDDIIGEIERCERLADAWLSLLEDE